MNAAGESICTATLIPRSGRPVPQQGTDKSLKLSLPFHDSEQALGAGAEWRSQFAVLPGGYRQPPTLGACRALSPPVLHGPTGTSAAQALPLAAASREKSSPSTGGPPAQQLVEQALKPKFCGRTAPSRARSLLTMAATAWPWLSELNLRVLIALGTNRENASSGGEESHCPPEF